MRTVRVPFAQLRTDPAPDAWQMLEGANAVPVPDVHPAWDAGVDLHIRRHIAFDGAALGDVTGLGEGASVRLVAGYECERARSRDFPWKHDVVLPSGFDGSAEFRIESARIAETVDLVVGAVLVSSGRGGKSTRAKVPGSWLWSERKTIVLDEGRGRFPMEWTDLGSAGLPREAAWFLDWSNQDWDAPTLGTIRLLLNSKHPAIGKVVELTDTDPRRALVIHSARFDIAKQLMMTALSSDDFLDGAEGFAEGSVGFSVRLLLRRCFQATSFATLRERMVNQAGEFHAEMQSGFGAFDIGGES